MGIDVNENDPRVKRTRRMLLQAFYDLATEKEMRTITVQDITERATLNRATFYAHFRDKDELMDAALRSRIREALSTEFPKTASFNKENLSLLFAVVCKALDTVRRGCPRSHAEHSPMLHGAFQKELYAFILEWIRCDPANAEILRHSPEAAASVLSWTLFGTATERSQNPGQDAGIPIANHGQTAGATTPHNGSDAAARSDRTVRSREAAAEQVVNLLVHGLGPRFGA